MTSASNIAASYYDWLLEKTGSRCGAYQRLCNLLYLTPFRYTLPLDGNREADGINLRYRFARNEGISDNDAAFYLDNGPCSVLEMMTALAIRIEEHIMADEEYGDRTPAWFNCMIYNLGLSGMTDARFNREEAEIVLDNWMNRDYGPDGSGNIFYIPNCPEDLRTIAIWYQAHWYIRSLNA